MPLPIYLRQFCVPALLVLSSCWPILVFSRWFIWKQLKAIDDILDEKCLRGHFPKTQMPKPLFFCQKASEWRTLPAPRPSFGVKHCLLVFSLEFFFLPTFYGKGFDLDTAGYTRTWTSSFTKRLSSIKYWFFLSLKWCGPLLPSPYLNKPYPKKNHEVCSIQSNASC